MLPDFTKYILQCFSKYILQGAQCWFSGNVDSWKLMEQNHHVSTWDSTKPSRFGIDLVPTFSFGENRVYDQVLVKSFSTQRVKPIWAGSWVWPIADLTFSWRWRIQRGRGCVGCRTSCRSFPLVTFHLSFNFLLYSSEFSLFRLYLSFYYFVFIGVLILFFIDLSFTFFIHRSFNFLYSSLTGTLSANISLI